MQVDQALYYQREALRVVPLVYAGERAEIERGSLEELYPCEAQRPGSEAG